MEITIGKQLNLRLLEQAADIQYHHKNGEIEAKVLNIRSSRRAQALLDNNIDRRSMQYQTDPKNSKIITLMIDNPDGLPPDIINGKYKISIKFEKI